MLSKIVLVIFVLSVKGEVRPVIPPVPFTDNAQCEMFAQVEITKAIAVGMPAENVTFVCVDHGLTVGQGV